ncbi:MAG TPA: hypothetical protein DD405_02590 [Desulfobacteraceae bacterium]|nr:hypothetical protein [Desulfobacteraceae bacterium]
MPAINFKKFEQDLKKKQETSFAPVYLIHGEEFLYKKMMGSLLEVMLPDYLKNPNYQSVAGINNNIADLISTLNTFSMLSELKVLAFCDSRIFYSKQDEGIILQKAKEAFDGDDIKKAALQLLNLMALLDIKLDDLKGEKRKKILNQGHGGADDPWIDDVVKYCISSNLSVPSGTDHMQFLQDSIKKGFPEKNHLIITTDHVDKRRGLYKTIKELGVVVDCTVPAGGRMEARKIQNSVLHDTLTAVLDKSRKKINPNGYSALCKMVGFDLRTFNNSLEKLVNYVGSREMITVEDVEYVLKRTKKDPLYEFTDAITDRNRDMALFYLASLLDGGEINHPLQLVTAITNQIRKLLLVKGFVESRYRSAWQPGCPYNHFQKITIPAVIEYDKEFLKEQKKIDEMLLKKGSKTSEKSASDLMVARTPKNSFPVYKMFQKSDRFKKRELFKAFESLGEADEMMKSTGMEHKLILERLVLQICSREQEIV